MSVPVKSSRRDWFQILRDLSAAGVPMAAVARKCNHHTTTVSAWAEGGDPKEADARIVLALYAKHCPLKYVDHQAQYEIRANSELWLAVTTRLDAGELEDSIAAEIGISVSALLRQVAIHRRPLSREERARLASLHDRPVPIVAALRQVVPTNDPEAT